jgi:hypothetical protein
MCCLLSLLVVLGPRVAIIFWALVEPARWQLAFGTFIWPLLGLIFLPWTTLMYVLVFPGGIEGLDWLWLGIAVVIDLAGYGGGYANRSRRPSTTVWGP